MDPVQDIQDRQHRLIFSLGSVALFLIIGTIFLMDGQYNNAQRGKTNVTSSASGNDDVVRTSRLLLSLRPTYAMFKLGEVKTVELVASFDKGEDNEHLQALKTEISFSNKNLKLADYIKIVQSGFSKSNRVDGPVQANQSGVIVVDLGVKQGSTGPSTSGLLGKGAEIVVAKIDLQAIDMTSQPMVMTIGSTRVVNDKGESIAADISGMGYTVN